MTYKLNKNHLTNWDAQGSNEKPIFNEDQDSYISERSSTISLEETTSLPKLTNKQLSPPPLSPSPRPRSVPKKQSHNLRYDYNELPENGVPLAIQVKEAKEEEKKRQQNIRKAPPGQGTLVPFPKTKPSEMSDNYFPSWRYYQAKNPDWTMRHRQTHDGRIIPYDPIDPSQYIHDPALSTPPIKSRRHHRKPHHTESVLQYDPDKKHYKIVHKDSLPTFRENYEEQSSSLKKYIPLHDGDNKRHSHRHHDKHKIENDSNDHFISSMSTSKSSQDSNNLTRTPSRSKHHSKKIHNDSLEENKKHQHTHHHHSPQQDHHHHHHHIHPSPESQHHHHHHHLHHSPFKEYVDSEFQVIDASFKKSERTPYFQKTQNPFELPPPSIYNQSSYLPPITRDYHYIPTSTESYRPQTLNKDWRDSTEPAKIYKPDPRPSFYDRYLNNIITEKIT